MLVCVKACLPLDWQVKKTTGTWGKRGFHTPVPPPPHVWIHVSVKEKVGGVGTALLLLPQSCLETERERKKKKKKHDEARAILNAAPQYLMVMQIVGTSWFSRCVVDTAIYRQLSGKSAAVYISHSRCFFRELSVSLLSQLRKTASIP